MPFKDITSTYKLPAGSEIPVLQLGVYKSPAEITKQSVKTALDGERFEKLDSSANAAQQLDTLQSTQPSITLMKWKLARL